MPTINEQKKYLQHAIPGLFGLKQLNGLSDANVKRMYKLVHQKEHLLRRRAEEQYANEPDLLEASATMSFEELSTMFDEEHPLLLDSSLSEPRGIVVGLALFLATLVGAYIVFYQLPIDQTMPFMLKALFVMMRILMSGVVLGGAFLLVLEIGHKMKHSRLNIWLDKLNEYSR